MLVRILLLFFLSGRIFGGEIDSITLVVKNLKSAAQKLALHGFTLKIPHTYVRGFQSGLVAQSIRLSDGTYLQLIEVKESNKESNKESITGSKGELAKWYQEQLKKGEGGTTLVLKTLNLKDLQKAFQRNHIESRWEKGKGYEWLSFKTHGPLENLAFISYHTPPHQNPELLSHANGTEGILKVVLSPKGDGRIWAKVLNLSQSQSANLSFSSTTYNSMSFVKEIVLKTQKKPLPPPISIGHTTLSFKIN